MARIAKVIGYLILVLGLLLHAADLCGYLLESDRLELYARIERAEDIPRGAPGFEKFLAAFPPPSGVLPADVTQIRSSNIIGSGGISAAVDIRYLVGDQKTGRVAGLIEASE